MKYANLTKEELIIELTELQQKYDSLEKQLIEKLEKHEFIEKTLIESEKKYRHIYDNALEGIFRTSIDGTRFEYNPALAEMLAFKNIENSQNIITNINTQIWANAEDRTKYILKLEKEELIRNYECQFKTFDGNLIWVSVSARLIRDEFGQSQYTEGFVEDITDKKNVAEALLKREQSFRSLYEESLIGIYRTTPAGEILLCNPILVKKLGYKSFDELKLINLENYGYHPNYDRKIFIDEIEKNGEVNGLESAWIRADGSTIFMRENAKAIRDANGKTLYFDGTVEDINDRKIAEEALRRSEDRFRKLSSIAHEGLMIHDKGLILDMNLAFAKILEYETAEELIGLNVYDIINLTEVSKLKLQSKIIENTDDTYDLDLINMNNEIVYVETKAENVFYQNKNARLVFMRDISQQKKSESLLKKKNEEIEAQNKIYLELNEKLSLANLELLDSKAIAEENSAKFKAIFENSISAIRISKDGRNLFFNRSYLNMFGYESENELININLSDLIAPRVLENTLNFISQKLKGDDTRRFYESIGIRKNRTEFQFELKVCSYTLSGEVYTMYILRDITERKLAEQALLDSEKRYRLLIDTANEGILVAQGQYLKFVNPLLVELMGYDRETLLSRPFLEFVHPDDRPLMVNNYQKRMAGELTEQKYNIKVLTNTDEIKWVEISGNRIDWEGEPALITFVNDITERKKAEEALLEREAKYHELYTLMRLMSDTMPDLVWAKDLNNHYLFANEAMCKILLCANDTNEPIGKDDLFFANRQRQLHPENPNWHTFGEICADTDTQVLQELREMQFDEYGNVKGTFLFLDVHKAPLYNGYGQLIGVVGSGRDITQQKKVEAEIIKARDKAEESDRLKTAFLNNISHEVRTPLNAIVGFTQLMIRPNQTIEKLTEYANLIDLGCEKFIEIITDIIEISEISANLIVAKFAQIEIKAFLSNLIEPFIEKTKSKNIDFIIDFQEIPNNYIFKTDVEKLSKIILHLLDNAVKFTNQGSVEITCVIIKDHFNIYIKDTGIGISEEMKRIIFLPFRQLETGLCRTYGGNGLGLAISKAYVNLLMGEMTVLSELDKGSTFSIWLPIQKTTLSSKQVISPQIQSKVSTVLIVEDDFSNYRLLVEVLNTFNIIVLNASNGKQAVEMCNLMPEIDLILMDIEMPIMDGYAATKLIKSQRPNLPIIAQTAYALDSEKQKYKDIFDDYITKPIRRSILIQTLDKYIQINKELKEW